MRLLFGELVLSACAARADTLAAIRAAAARAPETTPCMKPPVAALRQIDRKRFLLSQLHVNCCRRQSTTGAAFNTSTASTAKSSRAMSPRRRKAVRALAQPDPVIADEAKQSICRRKRLDCFVSYAPRDDSSDVAHAPRNDGGGAPCAHARLACSSVPDHSDVGKRRLHRLALDWIVVDKDNALCRQTWFPAKSRLCL